MPRSSVSLSPLEVQAHPATHPAGKPCEQAALPMLCIKHGNKRASCLQPCQASRLRLPSRCTRH